MGLELEEKILNAGAVVAIVGVFLPWIGGEQLGGSTVSYSGFGFYTTIIGVSVFALQLFVLLITLIPLLVVGLVGRLALKLNYLSLCGLLAGSMTDPPALAFVTQATGSEGPSIAYATVYPLTMFLRVLFAQFLVIYLL